MEIIEKKLIEVNESLENTLQGLCEFGLDTNTTISLDDKLYAAGEHFYDKATDIASALERIATSLEIIAGQKIKK